MLGTHLCDDTRFAGAGFQTTTNIFDLCQLSFVCLHCMDHFYGTRHEHKVSRGRRPYNFFHFRLLTCLQSWLQCSDLQYVYYQTACFFPFAVLMRRQSLPYRTLPLRWPLTRSLLVPILRPWRKLLCDLREPCRALPNRLEMAPCLLLLACI